MVSDVIKQKVLLKAGINGMIASDCEWIAIDIYKNLQKEVSITTLKRVFGFAKSNHHFSKYTLITLREYANLADTKMRSYLTAKAICSLVENDQDYLRPDHLVIEALEILLAQNMEFLPIVRQGEIIGRCYTKDIIYFLTAREKIDGTLFHKFNFTLESAIFILTRMWA